MPEFAETIKQITGGLTGFAVGAAVKNIEGWETMLKGVDAPGAQTIATDLGKRCPTPPAPPPIFPFIERAASPGTGPDGPRRGFPGGRKRGRPTPRPAAHRGSA